MYRVYNVFGRPVLAVPESPEDFSKFGWKRYHPFTRKRAIIQKVMQSAVLLRIDRLLYKLVDDPLKALRGNERGFECWLEQVRIQLGCLAAHPVLIWPPQKDRGRIYVHLLESDGQPIAFAKISFDQHNDECLQRESHTLRLLEEKNLQHCHTPLVLADGRWAGHAYLILEPFPLGIRPIVSSLESFPEKAVKELTGAVRVVELDEIESTPWWQRFSQMAEESNHLFSFKNELKRLIVSGSGLPVCYGHGDLGPANLVMAQNQLWMIDWEESSETCPLLTDIIGFDLAVHAKDILRDHQSALKLFNMRHMKNSSPEKRRDVMAALAFRLTFEEIIAGLCIRNLTSVNH